MPYQITTFRCGHCGGEAQSRHRNPQFCSPTCRNKARTGSGRPWVERFWKWVDRTSTPDGCWTWTGFLNHSGYGIFKRPPGTSQLAHRHAYELAYGPIPDGLHVCHTCDNPACVRADHLWLGTNADNVADRHRKGRTHTGHNPTYPLLKLNADAVRTIRAELSRGTHRRILAARFGVSLSAINHVAARHTWQHVP